MIDFSGQALLLDVEGTTTSVSYVVDVLFPFARKELNVFMRNFWNDPDVAAAREQIAADAGHESVEEWAGGPGLPPEFVFGVVRAEVVRLMDADAKTTGLKQLQGLLWRHGYESGELASHVYEDVPLALKDWTDAGKRVAIYSSGSELAQKLLFAHTKEGDLTPYLAAHFDTTVGPKKEAASYAEIARRLGVPAGEVLFLSDVQLELDAAKSAGMRTGLVRRPGDADLADPARHPKIASFAEVRLVGK